MMIMKKIYWLFIIKTIRDQLITVLTVKPCSWLHHIVSNNIVYAADSKASPFYQNLPDCAGGGQKLIKKKTSSKALLCPMIR